MRDVVLKCFRLAVIAALVTPCAVSERAAVLRPHPDYPLVFQDPAGAPLLLIGSYGWGMFSNAGFDYGAMLDTLHDDGLNFARVWLFWGTETLPSYDEKTGMPLKSMVPYLRPGPGTAHDGAPKYDLSRFNPRFFERLRKICAAAEQRGIYLQLCIFDGWILKTERWNDHAYHRYNNVNGVDGDPNMTGRGQDNVVGYCSLGNPGVMAYQQALVREIVDTVNGFGHVFFEIANENINPEWEAALSTYLHDYERTRPIQHQVMPLDIPNHWVVPQSWDPWTMHNGILAKRVLMKPLIFDTDWKISTDDDEVRRSMWAAVLTGAHYDYLDASFQPGSDHHGDARGTGRAKLRGQIGDLAAFMRRLRFWEMAPLPGACKAGNAIVFASKRELAAYFPQGGKAVIDLAIINEPREAFGHDPRTGAWTRLAFDPEALEQSFAAPDGKDWLLYVRNHGDTSPPGIPTDVRATAAGALSVRVTWRPAEKDGGVGFRVFRNGRYIGRCAGPGYRDAACAPENTYSYAVTAYDIGGNESERSAPSPPVTTPSRAATCRVQLGAPNRCQNLYPVANRDGDTKAGAVNGQAWREPVDETDKYFVTVQAT